MFRGTAASAVGIRQRRGILRRWPWLFAVEPCGQHPVRLLDERTAKGLRRGIGPTVATASVRRVATSPTYIAGGRAWWVGGFVYWGRYDSARATSLRTHSLLSRARSGSCS